MNTEASPIKPTVIDLDPDQVMEEGKTSAAENGRGSSPPPPKGKSSLAVPAFAAAVFIGAIGGGWLYRDLIGSYFPSNEMRSLTERVDSIGKGHEDLATQMQALDRLSTQLKTDVDAMENAVATGATETKSVGESLAATRKTVAALETALTDTRSAISDLANRPATTSDGTVAATLAPDIAARLVQLEQDVAALKAQKSGALDTAALTQSLADLKAKIEAGVSFADESDRLSRLLPAAAGLEILALHAAAGLPNAKGLATELAALKPDLPVPEAVALATEDAGLWDRLTDALSAIVTIRDAAAINWREVAEKAIAFTDAGDLAEAISVIDAQEAAKPVSLQNWRDRAAARLALEGAVVAVSESASRVLAAGQ